MAFVIGVGFGSVLGCFNFVYIITDVRPLTLPLPSSYFRMLSARNPTTRNRICCYNLGLGWPCTNTGISSTGCFFMPKSSSGGLESIGRHSVIRSVDPGLHEKQTRSWGSNFRFMSYDEHRWHLSGIVKYPARPSYLNVPISTLLYQSTVLLVPCTATIR